MRLPPPRYVLIAGFQLTLPHFYKILPGSCFTSPSIFELKQRSYQLRRRGIFQFFKEIIQVYGGVHLECLEYPPAVLSSS